MRVEQQREVTPLRRMTSMKMILPRRRPQQIAPRCFSIFISLRCERSPPEGLCSFACRALTEVKPRSVLAGLLKPDPTGASQSRAVAWATARLWWAQNREAVYSGRFGRSEGGRGGGGQLCAGVKGVSEMAIQLHHAGKPTV